MNGLRSSSCSRPRNSANRARIRSAARVASRDSSTRVLWTESRGPSPALVAFSGERAAFRTVEFLTAGIGNEHTRRAYHRAARRFLAWCNTTSCKSILTGLL